MTDVVIKIRFCALWTSIQMTRYGFQRWQLRTLTKNDKPVCIRCKGMPQHKINPKNENDMLITAKVKAAVAEKLIRNEHLFDYGFRIKIVGELTLREGDPND